MEYATATLAQNADRPSPALGQLKYASERIAIVTQRIDQFVERFHGPQPTSPSGAAGSGQPSPQNYRSDIDTLFATLDRLEGVTSALDTIG